MLRLIFIAPLFLIASPLKAFECEALATYGEGTRWECGIDAKRFSVLHLKGNYRQSLQQHAKLLSHEILEGPMSEIIQMMRKDLGSGGLVGNEIKNRVLTCYYHQMRDSVSREFLDAGQEFVRSLQSSLRGKSTYTNDEIEMAIYATELSIAAGGLIRKLEQDPLGTAAELAHQCGLRISSTLIVDLISALNPLSQIKQGCIGFVSPEQSSMDGVLMHARNLDANLVKTWNREPVLFLVEEPGYLKYAAIASAGVVYPGGVSGLNEAGISVSLHELSTSHYRTKHSGRKGELAPFLQQRILREARSLDEAIALVQRTKSFGAWTILVSDSKSQEVASIEFTGSRVEVARRNHNQPMGQSNHYLGSRMENQAFAYSFEKIFESQSRLSQIETAFGRDAGHIDLLWMINQLAGHTDSIEGFRAFGRTAVKAYNVLSSVTIPERNQIWMSIGDRLPAAHSQMAGFEIDFEEMRFWPIEARRTNAYEHIPSWEKSLETYVKARLAYEDGNNSLAYQLTLRALQQAQSDGIEETTYRYILGRLALEEKKPLLALFHFRILWNGPQKLAPYKRALIALYSTSAIQQLSLEDRRLRNTERLDYLKTADQILRAFDRQYDHFDLEAKIKMLRSLQKMSAVKLPKIDFVTVE
jgi:hypothetical protein